MQEKIEEIKHIQFSLWGMYKNFLADKDLNNYKNKADLLLSDCREYLKNFCSNLIITWTAIIEHLTEDFGNGCDVKDTADCITHIQNTIWAMYKDFLSDHDMKKYNRKMRELSQEYIEKGDKQLLSFCQNLLISWCPVISGFAEELNA